VKQTGLLSLTLLSLALSGCKRQDEVTDAGQLRLKAGRWENAYNLSQVDVPGLRQSHRDKITSEISKLATGPACLDPGLVTAPPASFFGGKGASDCKYDSYEITKGRAHIVLTCTVRGLGVVETELAGPISANQYDFMSKVSVRLPMIGRVNFQGTSTGVFAGACKGTE
jgi:hypothetical protein